MSQKVIIFNGNEPIETNTDSFFSHPYIDSIKEEEVIKMYSNTAVYNHVLTKTDPTKLKDAVKDLAYAGKVETGLSLLEQMVRDVHGDKLGSALILNVNHLIHKHESN